MYMRTTKLIPVRWLCSHGVEEGKLQSKCFEAKAASPTSQGGKGMFPVCQDWIRGELHAGLQELQERPGYCAPADLQHLCWKVINGSPQLLYSVGFWHPLISATLGLPPETAATALGIHYGIQSTAPRTFSPQHILSKRLLYMHPDEGSKGRSIRHQTKCRNTFLLSFLQISIVYPFKLIFYMDVKDHFIVIYHT